MSHAVNSSLGCRVGSGNARVAPLWQLLLAQSQLVLLYDLLLMMSVGADAVGVYMKQGIWLSTAAGVLLVASFRHNRGRVLRS